MKSLLLAALIFACGSISPPPAAADENTHREELETLLELFDMEEKSGESIDQMVTFHVQQDPRLGPYTGVLRKFYEKHMSWDSLKDDFIAIYMEEFSEEEIRELIAFYKTPVGRKAIKKMPLLRVKCARIGEEQLLKNLAEWHRMLQEETERLKKLQQ